MLTKLSLFSTSDTNGHFCHILTYHTHKKPRSNYQPAFMVTSCCLKTTFKKKSVLTQQNLILGNLFSYWEVHHCNFPFRKISTFCLLLPGLFSFYGKYFLWPKEMSFIFKQNQFKWFLKIENYFCFSSREVNQVYNLNIAPLSSCPPESDGLAWVLSSFPKIAQLLKWVLHLCFSPLIRPPCR